MFIFDLLCKLLHQIKSYMSQGSGVGIVDSLVARCLDDETIPKRPSVQNNFVCKLLQNI